METEAPSPNQGDHVRFQDSPASPSDLDDADSLLGEEGEAASLLNRLAEGGLDTESVAGCACNESLADIKPSLPALNVHVGHMTVYVQEDRFSTVRTAVHPNGAILRDL